MCATPWLVEIEEAIALPLPLTAAWRALDRAWEQADRGWFSAGDGDVGDAVDRQLECLLVRDHLCRLTRADLSLGSELLQLPGWSWRDLVELARRVPPGDPISWLLDLAEQLPDADLDALLAILESSGDTSHHLVPILVDRDRVDDALRLTSRVEQPFWFIAAAEALVPVLAYEERARLAADAWVRTARYAEFDRYGPGYAIALWLSCIPLWPLDHPARRHRLPWLERRVRALSPGELEASQDYADPRYSLARCWAELGEVERARTWLAEVDEHAEFYALQLAPLLPAQRRAIADVAFDRACLEYLGGDIDYVPDTTLEHIAALGADVVADMVDRIRDRFPVPLDRQLWLVAMVPFLPDAQASTVWHEAFELFAQRASHGMDEALDALLEGLIHTTPHVPGSSAELLNWIGYWPRPEPLSWMTGALDEAVLPDALRRLLARADVRPETAWSEIVKSSVECVPDSYAALPEAWQTALAPPPSSPDDETAALLAGRRAARPRRPWLDTAALAGLLDGLPAASQRACLDLYGARFGRADDPGWAVIADHLASSRWHRAACVAVAGDSWPRDLVIRWLGDPPREPLLGDALDSAESFSSWLDAQPDDVRQRALRNVDAEGLVETLTRLPRALRERLTPTIERWVDAHVPRSDLAAAIEPALAGGHTATIGALLRLAAMIPKHDQLRLCARRAARAGFGAVVLEVLREHAEPLAALEAIVFLLELEQLDGATRATALALLEQRASELAGGRVLPALHQLFFGFPWLSRAALASIWERRACGFEPWADGVNVSEVALALLLGGPQRLGTVLRIQSSLLGND
ncbi:MAG TPA: hypothetical protein VML75_04845, partial [Kofleriaceae bacterium]|nr:hypothetical protein [Kofleriaceae bacterium]